MDLKYLVFVLLCVLVIYWELRKQIQYSTVLVTLLASISALLFRDSGLLLSVAAILVILAALTRSVVPSNMLSGGGITKIAFLFTICLAVIGVMVGLLNVGLATSRWSANGLDELASVSLFPLVGLLYYRQIALASGRPSGLRLTLLAFSAGSLAHVMAVALQAAGLQELVPAFLVSSASIVDESANALEAVQRFGGLIGDYELIVDYALMVLAVAFVVLIQGRGRLLPIAAIVCATLIGLYSGTRSFIVSVLLVTISLLVVSPWVLKARLNRTRFGVIALVSVLLLAVGWGVLSDRFVVFDRLQISVQQLSGGGGLESAVNRHYLDTFELISKKVPAFGLGAFLNSDLYGDEIVSHNVFFAVYCRYGLLGVAALLFLLFSALSSLYRSYLSARTDAARFISILLMVFTAVLVAQELKVSALRSTSGVMIYAFWFAVVFQFAARRDEAVLAGGAH